MLGDLASENCIWYWFLCILPKSCKCAVKSGQDKMMSADSEVLLMEVKQERKFNMNNDKPSY